MEQTKEIDIDLRKAFFMLRKKVIYIVLVTVIAAVSVGLFTEFFVDPTYSASVSMYVNSNTDRVSTDSTITYNEIVASKELVGTYIVVLKSDTVLEKVIDDLNLNISTDSLRSMISAASIEESEAFKVVVNTKNAKLSMNIANSIAKVAPDEIIRVVKAGSVEVIDGAKMPKAPSSPNIKKNVLVGAAVGFIISFLGFFIYELFDTTITNEKDIEREFDIPVLGTVPCLDADAIRKSNKYPKSQNAIKGGTK